jgi:hypothetical protein
MTKENKTEEIGTANNKRSAVNELVSRVEYAIYLAVKPSNLVPKDWHSGAILGDKDSYRAKIRLAAKLALIEVDRG